MKIRDKREPLKELIGKLRQRQIKSRENVWGAIAEALNRPRRKSFEIALSKLDKGDGAIVAPGTVMAGGAIARPVNVYAVRFTKAAREKIGKAGGKCHPIYEILDIKTLSEIRILV
ncbi:MAG: uL15 family ribosomal protein [Candidatus Aenigmarchaeota archaeon]|nr:uL15 family ribosomal protein [Candidatus Aenigmarchaeota archaeon]